MGDYQLKRGPWKRPGGPCPECGASNCRTVESFACWTRAFKRAMGEGNYMRSTGHTPTLRAAGLTILVAPQPAGNEVPYAPAWAVQFVTTVREVARKKGERVRINTLSVILRKDPRFGPPSPELLARLDALRAFAALRGWKHFRGMWERA